jgi:hypothetical protein
MPNLSGADPLRIILDDFKTAVNMSAAELEAWLETEDSWAVGWKGPDGKGEGESVGHKSGRRIVQILRSHVAELEPDDYAHMRKVVGYVRRHLAQRPTRNVETSRWRHSLMNWGHDPCTKARASKA